MPSSTRDQFIAAGMRLYPQYGYAKLSVRLLAAESGLSSGMFHHLFENKDEFVAELLKLKYNEGFSQLALHVQPGQGVRQNLHQAMLFLAFFTRDHLHWIHRIFADSTDGVACVAEFVKHYATRHVELLLGLLQQGIDEGALVPTALPQYFSYLTGAVQMPMVLGSRVIEAGIAPDVLAAEFNYILSDEAIEQRIGWALASLFAD